MPTTGYPSSTSVLPGGILNLHLSATVAGLVDCVFERVGFGAMGVSLGLNLSPIPDPANGWLGFGWPAQAFNVPSTWPSGLYQMRARGPGDANHTFVLEFVVRATSPGSTSKILLAADFITPQAYNGAGGKSLYDWPSGRGSRDSFDRPLGELSGHLELITWLNANDVTAMAGTRGLLFAATASNALWYRQPVEADITWTPVGTGPAGGLRAMCASGSMLYAIDGTGQLVSRPASKGAAGWTTVASMPANTTINAMTSYNGVLFASTSGNRLLRTGFDFIEESRAWVDIHHCNFARALAVVDGMLFVATTQNRLWWLDLRHGALDALSAET